GRRAAGTKRAAWRSGERRRHERGQRDRHEFPVQERDPRADEEVKGGSALEVQGRRERDQRNLGWGQGPWRCRERKVLNVLSVMPFFVLRATLVPGDRGNPKEYGECSEKHIFPLNCKRAMEKMDDCLRQINNPERVNQAKLEYMKLRRERRERYESRDARQKQAAAQKETETAAAKAPPLAGAQEG
ncbi:MAG: hypothetical protein BJ554DRAFT_5309, partial [Olpidium bornovanus]